MKLLISVVLIVLLCSGCCRRRPLEKDETITRLNYHISVVENELEAVSECWHMAEVRAAKLARELRIIKRRQK